MIGIHGAGERERLRNLQSEPWRLWGPYVSDRQWGTVREDYSATGEAWEYLPFDDAHRRAYRWGEDGIFGISDDHQNLCFGITLWNGKDDRLKERFFGLTGNQGNHGEDVKEYYFFLDNLPSHAYMHALYKYPQAAFPYAQLLAENAKRGRQEPEYELLDTGIFDENRYFDVNVRYAKASPTDIVIDVRATNRGPQEHEIHLLPTIWFRNMWAWKPFEKRPMIWHEARADRSSVLCAQHSFLGKYRLYCEGSPTLLFTDNDSNAQALWGTMNETPYTKDGIDRAVVHGEFDKVNPRQAGTKACAWYRKTLAPGASMAIRLRLTNVEHERPFLDFDDVFAQRRRDADLFYERINPFKATLEQKNVQRQAFAGLLWSKQFYKYNVAQWLAGDSNYPPPPPGHEHGRNADWYHLDAADVISMPDTWEYPWFASWDLAFHVVAFSLIDPDFAKQQLLLLTREWYMHPNGQLPAYEWAFDDVNPPTHAWAALRVFQIERRMYGTGDYLFLERVFQKLLLNFTWWVNRKDVEGNNIFQGGFLGLDNIGIFDRSKELPTGGHLNQSDGTSWMAVYSLYMLAIAIELAKQNSAYEDVATKFFEHFLYIAHAMNHLGGNGLWDEEDGFYYDMLKFDDGREVKIKVRSMVGLIPLLACYSLEADDLDALPHFKRRVEWFMKHRPDLAENVASMQPEGERERRLLAIVDREQLTRILHKMLDEENFLSRYGVRALSRYHLEHPYVLRIDGHEYRVDYEPAESTTGLFGGNSNWRGPVWFPLNYLLIEALQKYHRYYGDKLKVECPTDSSTLVNLWDVGCELSNRLIDLFLLDEHGRRPVYGASDKFQSDPLWRDKVLFYEYFNGDNGAGLGASHQTGWTAIVAKMIEQVGEYGVPYEERG